jgi:hypothetical protein
VGQQDEPGNAQHPALARKAADPVGQDRAIPGGEIMFQKISLMWVGLSKIDIVLTALICVTIGALYAAFLT